MVISNNVQANKLIGQLAKKLTNFKEIKFRKSRFGRGSGSPVQLEVGENDPEKLKFAVSQLKTFLKELPEIKNVEVEQPLQRKEYKLDLRKEEIKKRIAALDKLAAENPTIEDRKSNSQNIEAFYRLKSPGPSHPPGFFHCLE